MMAILRRIAWCFAAALAVVGCVIVLALLPVFLLLGACGMVIREIDLELYRRRMIRWANNGFLVRGQING